MIRNFERAKLHFYGGDSGLNNLLFQSGEHIASLGIFVLALIRRPLLELERASLQLQSPKALQS